MFQQSRGDRRQGASLFAVLVAFAIAAVVVLIFYGVAVLMRNPNAGPGDSRSFFNVSEWTSNVGGEQLEVFSPTEGEYQIPEERLMYTFNDRIEAGEEMGRVGEVQIFAPVAGTVVEVNVSPGQEVEYGALLFKIQYK